jgi:hypothetical protein
MFYAIATSIAGAAVRHRVFFKKQMVAGISTVAFLLIRSHHFLIISTAIAIDDNENIYVTGIGFLPGVKKAF